MKIKQSQLTPGRWLRVLYDDVGARDCILLEKRDGDDFLIFEPYEGISTIVRSQILAIGNTVQCKGNGLGPV